MTATESWAQLRALRADPPRSASKGERRGAFSASLEQAERLWEASLTVGAPASPLLKFYSLLQAGHALCAAHAPKGNGWRAPEGHGLGFKVDREALNSDPLHAVSVYENGRGRIQVVADVLGSPTLSQPASLATIIAATPTAFLAFKEDLDPDVQPIIVDFGSENWLEGELAQAILSPVPESLLTTRAVPAGPNNLAYTATSLASLDRAREWVASYPALAAIGPPADFGPVNPMTWDRRPDKSFNVRVLWPKNVLHDWEAERAVSDWSLADKWSVNQRGLVLPAIAGNNTAIHPIIGWWLTLYGLSMLCRYYPESWGNALNLDTSRWAVPLETLLITEAARVPELLITAVEQEPHQGAAQPSRNPQHGAAHRSHPSDISKHTG